MSERKPPFFLPRIGDLLRRDLDRGNVLTWTVKRVSWTPNHPRRCHAHFTGVWTDAAGRVTHRCESVLSSMYLIRIGGHWRETDPIWGDEPGRDDRVSYRLEHIPVVEVVKPVVQQLGLAL